MIFKKKGGIARKARQKDDIDFTLLEKVGKRGAIETTKQEQTAQADETAIPNFLGSMFNDSNQGQNTSSIVSSSGSSSFIEQKLMDIYDKILRIEESIEELKKKLRDY